MGVKIAELLPSSVVRFEELSHKTVAIDASLFLYQFLASIRQPDGTPLTDSSGQVTSHLVGLFSRSTRLMEYGIRLVYVFDGKPPELKRREHERRATLKADAAASYQQAAAEHDTEAMRKYASRSARLSKEMIEEAKLLVVALGLPIVQAPSEAEAQAAHIVKQGDAFAVATQDADALMFGATRVIRNLSFVGKRKQTSKLAYTAVEPELVVLRDALSRLAISREQLIALCMLVGTDYNLGGIRGVGQKTALKLVKQHGTDFDALFAEVAWPTHYPGWKEVFETIVSIPVTDEYKLAWSAPDRDAVHRLLVERHEFSEERVSATLERLTKTVGPQKGLGEFF